MNLLLLLLLLLLSNVPVLMDGTLLRGIHCSERNLFIVLDKTMLTNECQCHMHNTVLYRDYYLCTNNCHYVCSLLIMLTSVVQRTYSQKVIKF